MFVSPHNQNSERVSLAPVVRWPIKVLAMLSRKIAGKFSALFMTSIVIAAYSLTVESQLLYKSTIQNVGARDTASLDINRIRITLNNRGTLVYNSWGAYWSAIPGDGNMIVFDHGLWIIGKENGVVGAGIAQWGSSYAPGPIINGQPAFSDPVRYRTYRITRADDSLSNPDYAQWPVDLGAPVNADGRPKISGDQMVWEVYNAADTSIRNPAFSIGVPFPRLNVEVHQSVFARAGTDCALLSNVVFLEWTLINKGISSVDSAYVSLWTDIDFGDLLSNVPAIDTVDQLGYCWQDVSGSNAPPKGAPAVGYSLLYGPIVPSIGDTGVFKGARRPGVRNLPITSFWGIIDDSPGLDFLGPAYTMETAWNIARGLDKHGMPIVDPTTGGETKFPLSGDPVTGSGWVYSQPAHGGGSGFNFFTGPFTMAAGDTQWVCAALIPARGTDRFESIRLLREQAASLRAIPYDSLLNGSFPHVPCPGEIIPTRPSVLQNYPNPFNAGTTIEYDVSEQVHAWIRVYDLLGRLVATLVDEQKAPGHYSVRFDAGRYATGVYFYQLSEGSFVSTRKLLLLK